VAALGVCLCLLAAAFGTPALYVPGTALVLLAAAAAASVGFASRGLQLVREGPGGPVEEGERVLMLTRVLGPRGVLRGGELAGGAHAQFTPRRRLQGDRLRFTVLAGSRGRHTIAPSVLRLRDPFGICERRVLSAPSELLVLPRVQRLAPGALARLGVVGAGRHPAGGAAELDGLRPYRPGTPASRIHWPTVARTGTLVERGLLAECDELPLLVLDAFVGSHEQALDMAVRAAASLALALARAGGCSILLAGDQRPRRLGPDLGGWPALHRRLALLEPARTPARAAIERAPLLLWVSA